MLNQAQLLRACNEFLLLLLGVFLIALTFTGRYAVPRRSPTWIALGAFLIYWGLRAWARSGRFASRWGHRLRGGSIALVGVLMLAIAWLPLLPHAPALLDAAGSILAFRGLAGIILSVRTP